MKGLKIRMGEKSEKWRDKVGFTLPHICVEKVERNKVTATFAK